MEPTSLRKCKKCNRDKPLIDFPLYCREPERRRHECHACNRARLNQHYVENADHIRKQRRDAYRVSPSTNWTPEQRERKYELSREVTQRMRELVYHQYGNRCSCCGEDNPLFLTLDHVNNDGHKVRKVHGMSGALYRWVIRNGFPDVLQLLCYNCNMGKARNKGICPHQARSNDYPLGEYAASQGQRKRTAFICD